MARFINLLFVYVILYFGDTLMVAWPSITGKLSSEEHVLENVHRG